MKVLITGGTGFVGRHIIEKLGQQGDEILLFSRNHKKAKSKYLFASVFEWDYKTGHPPQEAIDQAESIIHLMGENISSKRWTKKEKEKIYRSRIESTRKLGEAIAQRTSPLESFVSTSAVGYYDVNLEKEVTENSPNSDHFLARVCHAWEAEAKKITNTKRLTILRLGVVLGHDGGALSKLLPLFKAGLGGKVSSGKQYMSWIHVDDLAQLFVNATSQEKFEGIYNAVAPQYITNQHFTKALAQALHRPALFPVPAFVLKIAMGEMSSIILDSQKIVPQKLLEQSHQFKYPTIKAAFEDITRQRSRLNP